MQQQLYLFAQRPACAFLLQPLRKDLLPRKHFYPRSSNPPRIPAEQRKLCIERALYAMLEVCNLVALPVPYLCRQNVNQKTKKDGNIQPSLHLQLLLRRGMYKRETKNEPEGFYPYRY
jgi:hypothetical protein